MKIMLEGNMTPIEVCYKAWNPVSAVNLARYFQVYSKNGVSCVHYRAS